MKENVYNFLGFTHKKIQNMTHDAFYSFFYGFLLLPLSKLVTQKDFLLLSCMDFIHWIQN